MPRPARHHATPQWHLAPVRARGSRGRPEFQGRVLVGVAPDVFFSGYEYRSGWLKYLRHQSPSDRVGKWLSMHLVEPYLAFYDDDFALFTVIKRQAWPARPGRDSHTEVRKLATPRPIATIGCGARSKMTRSTAHLHGTCGSRVSMTRRRRQPKRKRKSARSTPRSRAPRRRSPSRRTRAVPARAERGRIPGVRAT